MSSRSDSPAGRRRARPASASSPRESTPQRAALREQLRHHVSRIAHRCTVAELAKPDSRTALSLRLVLFCEALHQSGMLGSVDDLNAGTPERCVRNCLRPAFRGDVKQVERALAEVTKLPAAEQSAVCSLLAEVGWQLFDGKSAATPETRAG